MPIELTESQSDSLATAKWTRVVDPKTKADYVLVPIDQTEGLRSALEEIQRELSIRRIGFRSAVSRLIEDE